MKGNLAIIDAIDVSLLSIVLLLQPIWSNCSSPFLLQIDFAIYLFCFLPSATTTARNLFSQLKLLSILFASFDSPNRLLD